MYHRHYMLTIERSHMTELVGVLTDFPAST